MSHTESILELQLQDPISWVQLAGNSTAQELDGVLLRVSSSRILI